jgi:hypothetical protein
MRVDYYINILGLTVVERLKVDGKRATRFTYAHNPKHFIELVELGEPIDHAVGIGRLAIALPTEQLSVVEKRVKSNKDGIHTERVSLDTPGKATVEVIILLDRDGYEICIVGAEAYWELAQPKVGADLIDFDQRRANGSKE